MRKFAQARKPPSFSTHQSSFVAFRSSGLIRSSTGRCLRRRTPGPSPFSSTKMTPATSSADRRTDCVELFGAVWSVSKAERQPVNASLASEESRICAHYGNSRVAQVWPKHVLSMGSRASPSHEKLLGTFVVTA
jgi:hypothetical protein